MDVDVDVDVGSYVVQLFKNAGKFFFNYVLFISYESPVEPSNGPIT